MIKIELKARTLSDFYSAEEYGYNAEEIDKYEKWVPLEEAQKLEVENAIMNQHNMDIEKENVRLARQIVGALKIIDNYDGDIMNGSYVVYYYDYGWNAPTSYWKMGFGYSNNTSIVVSEAISKANLVSSPVVIVAPYWFVSYFHNVTNAEGQPVKYQWYGNDTLG